MVKTSSSNPGDAGSIPGQETEISQVTGRLSPYTSTKERSLFAAMKEPVCCNQDSTLCMLSLVAQSCLTLCDPMDCSPPGPHGL